MKKKKLLLIALLLVWVAPSFAAKVDTLLIKSPSMNKDVQVVRTERIAGTGIVRSIRLIVMKLLFHRNW